MKIFATNFLITAFLFIVCPTLIHASELDDTATTSHSITRSSVVTLENRDATDLIEILKNDTTMTHLTLHKCVIPLGTFIDALSMNTTLRQLSLNYNRFTGGYPSEQIALNTTLTSLTMIGNYFPNFNSLNLLTNMTSSLESFTFGPHFTGSARGGSFDVIPIEKITFSGKNLEENPTLNRLVLKSYLVNTSLLSRLLKNTVLRTLHLEGAKLDDSTIDRVSIALNANTSLTKLSLPYNSIRSAKLFYNMQHLDSLDLSNNGLVDLEFFNMPNLTHLNLSNNKFSGGILPLANLTNLVSLNLNGCTIPDVTPLITLIETSLNLEELDVRNIKFTPADHNLLMAALRGNQTITQLRL